MLTFYLDTFRRYEQDLVVEMAGVLIAVNPQQSLHLLHDALRPVERPAMACSLLVVVRVVVVVLVVLYRGQSV